MLHSVRNFVFKLMPWLIAGWIIGAMPCAYGQGANLKVAGLEFDLTGFFRVTYDSNINGSSNGSDDLILEPGITLVATKELSDVNTISIAFGASFREYLYNTELSSTNNFISLTPDSNVAFTILMGNVTITVYDQLSYTVDPTDAFVANPDTGTITSANASDFGRFDNTVGVDILWDLNDVRISLNLSREDLIPTSERFKFTQRATYTASPMIQFVFSERFFIGVFGGVTHTDNKLNFNNDTTSYFIGPLFHFEPNELWAIDASFDVRFFDIDSGGRNADTTGNETTFEYDVVVSNILTDLISHSVGLSRQADLGFISNTVIRDIYEYDIIWQARSDVSIIAFIAYEDGKASGGLLPERYHRWSTGFDTAYRLTTKATFSVGYEYQTRTSNIGTRNFNRNIITVALAYDF